MKHLTIIKFSIFFLIGFLVANFINYYMVYGLESPLSKNINYLGFVSKDAPSDFLTEKQIQIYDDKIVIYVDNASISRYAPTGSMKPLLDENSNGIRIIPENSNQINVGDIITFQENSYFIVHRVIEKGLDSKGVYFITKGDNNEIGDGKIRFEQIRYKTIGILW
jgi:hypothetical protein